MRFAGVGVPVEELHSQGRLVVRDVQIRDLCERGQGERHWWGCLGEVTHVQVPDDVRLRRSRHDLGVVAVGRVPRPDQHVPPIVVRAAAPLALAASMTPPVRAMRLCRSHRAVGSTTMIAPRAVGVQPRTTATAQNSARRHARQGGGIDW